MCADITKRFVDATAALCDQQCNSNGVFTLTETDTSGGLGGGWLETRPTSRPNCNHSGKGLRIFILTENEK